MKCDRSFVVVDVGHTSWHASSGGGLGLGPPPPPPLPSGDGVFFFPLPLSSSRRPCEAKTAELMREEDRVAAEEAEDRMALIPPLELTRMALKFRLATLLIL